MNRIWLIKALIVSSLSLVSFAAAVSAYAYSGEKFSTEAKINISEVRAIALKTYPGEIAGEELEREKGVAACATPSTSAVTKSRMK